jgi:multidrug efflux pump subunit AcrB
VGVPVAFRFSGQDTASLRDIAERAETILRQIPSADRVRDDWGQQTLALSVQVDPARAALSGITHVDAALSSAAASSGRTLTVIRDGEREIPVLLKLDRTNRPGLSILNDMILYSERNRNGININQAASVDLRFLPEKIRRRNHFRTITVSAFPAPGIRPSEVFAKAGPEFEKLERSLPPGYRMEIGGEKEAQVKGFRQVLTAMVISLFLIYLALVFEFKSALKPLLVFSAVPFGIVGAAASLMIANTPFGFMAFLGVVSLIGVIVSHIIVLFDFIEDAKKRGLPLLDALSEAGVVRFRPVMITVGATVLGLIPLALNGGPLWEPLCFAQIGGLTVAAAVTLILVPVIYAFFVLDLGVVKWRS